MPYLFHEPVLATPPARVNALPPGLALTIAVVVATLVMIGVSQLPVVRAAADASQSAVTEQAR